MMEILEIVGHISSFLTIVALIWKFTVGDKVKIANQPDLISAGRDSVLGPEHDKKQETRNSWWYKIQKIFN